MYAFSVGSGALAGLDVTLAERLLQDSKATVLKAIRQ